MIRPSTVAFTLAAMLGASSLHARKVHSEMAFDGRGFSAVQFALLDAPIGRTVAPSTTRRAGYLSGGTIAAIDGGLLVIDEDSGKLVLTGDWGAPRSTLLVGAGAAQLVVDDVARRAYVADRSGDRIIVAAYGARLAAKTSFATRAEPYGVALSPDRKTLLVTTVADHQLTAYDADAGTELWSIDIGAEPRGISISTDGKIAMVGSLTTGTVSKVNLATRDVDSIPLLAGSAGATGFGFGGGVAVQAAGIVRSEPGRGFARSAFAPQFIGHGLAVVPHQISVPHQAEGSENAGSYGGGFSPPVTHRVAVIGPLGVAEVSTVQIGIHQPRATAYDPATDRLYLVGYGSDELAVIGDVSQASIYLAYQTTLAKDGNACGPTGVTILDGRAAVFCSLTRNVSFVSDTDNALALTVGAELAPTRLSADALAGRKLFRTGNDPILSANGALACESCHPEGRTDGLSWRIESKTLQTPLLAGRVAGTHPFKWDGKDADLTQSLTNTVVRLGGGALSADQTRQLAAFVETLPRVRTPTPSDRKAVARGKKLFASSDVGCTVCHGGATLSDGAQHDIATDLEQTDTPSLIGVAASAPYYHDGSASSLRALVLENGSVHGMGNVTSLTPTQVDDLVAYLQTL